MFSFRSFGSSSLSLCVFLAGCAFAAGGLLDGEYNGAEESVSVKGGKVVKCDGFAFWIDGSPRNGSTCAQHSFHQISPSVISVTRRVNGDSLFLCKHEYPRGAKYGEYSCTPSGWSRSTR